MWRRSPAGCRTPSPSPSSARAATSRSASPSGSPAPTPDPRTRPPRILGGRDPAGSLEDDGPAPVDDDAVLRVPPDRAGEAPRLGLSTPGSELIGAQRVVDAEHLLLDDRAFVQVPGDVVRRRADELDPPGMCLVVRASALEARQHRMVDVDRPALERVAEIV